jgi:hypothetical protein
MDAQPPVGSIFGTPQAPPPHPGSSPPRGQDTRSAAPQQPPPHLQGLQGLPLHPAAKQRQGSGAQGSGSHQRSHPAGAPPSGQFEEEPEENPWANWAPSSWWSGGWQDDEIQGSAGAWDEERRGSTARGWAQEPRDHPGAWGSAGGWAQEPQDPPEDRAAAPQDEAAARPPQAQGSSPAQGSHTAVLVEDLPPWYVACLSAVARAAGQRSHARTLPTLTHPGLFRRRRPIGTAPPCPDPALPQPLGPSPKDPTPGTFSELPLHTSEQVRVTVWTKTEQRVQQVLAEQLDLRHPQITYAASLGTNAMPAISRQGRDGHGFCGGVGGPTARAPSVSAAKIRMRPPAASGYLPQPQ